ncbi:Tol biopolymer transport system component [Flavobacterium sp. PL11]|jgi:Tol biopolymer transport system component|uniref:carboxypeptidase-like regulatory domain-containing protein n=1 Tax=Flavobacterium sp. PL11 TaxID=3071717 RepID=UPI002E0B3D8B|nr:Tol biopolymer transport system component [Flavobacterium sp. PL11]
MKNLIFLLVIMFVFSSCAEDKINGGADVYGSVSGKVVSNETFEPLENVKVFSSPTSSIVFTDAEGKFTIPNVKVGEYSIQAQKEGFLSKFEAVTINKNLASEVIFELTKSTGTNIPPIEATVVAPLNGAVGQNLSTKIEWNATDPNSDVLTYEVTLRNDKNSTVSVYSDIKEKEFLLTNLLHGIKYFWQVAVTDSKSKPVLSAVFTFSTLEFPITRFLIVKKVNFNNVIYAADQNKTLYQITNSENNSWRPRKNNQSGKIAYIQSNGTQSHIYTMNPDGSNKMKITNSVPIAGFNPDYIGFSWNDTGDKIIYPNFDKLYEINSNGSGLKKIYQTPNGKFISECDWSADGSKIAIKVNDSDGYNAAIYIISPTGSVISTVLSEQTGALGSLDFSVTGNKLLYTKDVSQYESSNYRQLDNRIFEYNFDTAKSIQLSMEKIAGTNDFDARYSPNEAEVVFVNTSNDGTSERTIFKTDVNPSGSNTFKRESLFVNSYMPDWE